MGKEKAIKKALGGEGRGKKAKGGIGVTTTRSIRFGARAHVESSTQLISSTTKNRMRT